jgi:hypothetical protein
MPNSLNSFILSPLGPLYMERTKIHRLYAIMGQSKTEMRMKHADV